MNCSDMGKWLGAQLVAAYKNFAHLPDYDEADLDASRRRLISALCEIQRLKDRAFLPKKVGEIVKLTPKDLENALLKNIMQAVQKELTQGGLEFHVFYYRQLIRENDTFRATLQYFCDLVEKIQALRSYHASSQPSEYSFSLAAFDQAEPGLAIALMSTQDKVRFAKVG